MSYKPGKRYHILYVDPPWPYKDKRKSGRTRCGAENHYECLSIQELCDLPVELLAEDNAVIFMWVTFPMILDSKDPSLSPPGLVMKSWGFRYKTLGFVWIKVNKDESVWHGVGSYAKSNPEVCLMGVRGKVGRLIKDPVTRLRIATDPKEKLSVVSNHVSSVIHAPRGRHSRKPPIVRTKIVELFGDVSRIEVFARDSADGWDGIGDELNGIRVEQVRRKDA